MDRDAVEGDVDAGDVERAASDLTRGDSREALLEADDLVRASDEELRGDRRAAAQAQRAAHDRARGAPQGGGVGARALATRGDRGRVARARCGLRGRPLGELERFVTFFGPRHGRGVSRTDTARREARDERDEDHPEGGAARERFHACGVAARGALQSAPPREPGTVVVRQTPSDALDATTTSRRLFSARARDPSRRYPSSRTVSPHRDVPANARATRKAGDSPATVFSHPSVSSLSPLFTAP